MQKSGKPLRWVGLRVSLLAEMTIAQFFQRQQ